MAAAPPTVENWLEEPASVSPTTAPSQQSLTPKTDAALTGTELSKLRSLYPEEQFKARNIQGGVPLETLEEVSPMVRFGASLRRNQEEQFTYLQGVFGKEGVRLSDTGEPIVRVVDPDTQKPKDILLNAHKMTFNDFVGLLASAPEVAGGLIAARMGGKSPVGAKLTGGKGVTGEVIRSAIGAEAAGALKDVAVSESPEAGEIASERLKLAGLDVLLGGGAAGAGRMFNFIRDPLKGARTEIQFNALEAQRRFAEDPRFNIFVPLSVGEATGSAAFSRTEAFLENLPGGARPFKEFAKQKEAALLDLQNKMMGQVPFSDEAIGRQAMDELERKVAPKIEAAATAKRSAQTGISGHIEGIVGSLTQPQREIYKSALGRNIRDRVTALRDAAQAESDRLYAEVKAAPGGTGKVFETDDLAGDAKKILKSLPRKGNVPLKDFAPPDVINRLQSLAELGAAKGKPANRLSLSELQSMRRDTYEAMSATEGVAGRGEHYLNEIAKILTKAIDDGVDAMPTPELKNALAAANQHYKGEVVPFRSRGITELFRRPEESGQLGDAEIMEKFLGERAIDRYDLFKQFLGAGSQEMTRVKRMIADDLIERSRFPGEITIDAEGLIKRLTDFRNKNREISDEIFGNRLAGIIDEAKQLSVTQTDKIDVKEVGKLLDPRNRYTFGRLQALIDAEREADKIYANNILTAAARGKAGETLRPVEFVNRFVDNASPNEVRQVLGALSDRPELVEDIQAKTLEKLFRQSARKSTSQDVHRLEQGSPGRVGFATELAEKVYKDKTMREKLETILGPERFTDLKSYIDLINASEAKERAYQSAAGLATGSLISNLIRNGPFRYLEASVKDFVAAKLITSSAMRFWLAKGASAEGSPLLQGVTALGSGGAEAAAAFANLMASNPVFIRSVIEEFGEGSPAEQVLFQIKSSIDKSLTNAPATIPQPPSGKTVEQFLDEK